MSGRPDHEHIAETLVEDDLGGDSGVAATEQHRGGMLTVDQLGPAIDPLARMLRSSGDESLITLGQSFPRGDRV